MQWRKLTVDTKFQLDMVWWERQGRNFRLYVWDQLCDECREQIPTHVGTEEVDWIDPETAEVKKADALLQCLLSVCARKPDYIHSGLPLVTAIFRILLINGNKPMSARELHEHIPWKSPELILAALKTAQHELGIFPVWAAEEDAAQKKAA